MKNPKQLFTVRKVGIGFLVLAFWLFIWQIAYSLVGSDLLISSPMTVLRRFIQLAGTAEFWLIIGRSFARIMIGFLLALLTGTLLGTITSHVPALDQLIRLPMSMIKATPVASFVILALMWLSGRNLSIFICFLVVLPMIWTSVDQGFRSVDPKLLEVGKVFHLSIGQRIRAIYVPAILPYLLSTLRVAIGFVWKSGVAGEVIAAPQGTIGRQLYDAKVYLETADLFTWTFVVIVLSIIIEKLVILLIDRVAARYSALGAAGRETEPEEHAFAEEDDSFINQENNAFPDPFKEKETKA
ncbi:MAG: ABC transporter permease subunit [Firmicutes bacterium]|nr:ABC transporter permease subunit [Bacillota bacterium]